MSTSGPNNWGTSADYGSIGTVTWTGLGPAPGSPTASSWAGTAVSHYLLLSSFGFGLPTIALVDGVQVAITTSITSGGGGWSAKDNSVKLVKSANVSPLLSGADHSAGALWSALNQYGGASDTWGVLGTGGGPLGGTDVNDVGFGVAISGVGTVGGGGGYAVLTGATMTITWHSAEDGSDEGWLSSDLGQSEAAVMFRQAASRPRAVPYRCSLRPGAIYSQTRALRFDRPPPLFRAAA